MPALQTGHSRILRATNALTHIPSRLQVKIDVIQEAAKVLILSSARAQVPADASQTRTSRSLGPPPATQWWWVARGVRV